MSFQEGQEFKITIMYRERLRETIKSNIRMYLIIGVIGIAVVLYLLVSKMAYEF